MGCGASSSKKTPLLRDGHGLLGEEDNALQDFEPANFEEGMRELYPDSIGAQNLLDESSSMLEKRGFSRDNTTALVSVCRDKLASGMLPLVARLWGEPVDACSIAGFCAAGKSAITTLCQHAPREYERTRIFILAMPHIAISSAGQVGSPEGILTRLRKELESGHVNLQADPLDTEYFEVKQKILEKVSYGRKLPSLAMLTDIASDLVADNVAALIRDCVKLETTDVAVLTGVQVYGPEAKDWVYTKSFYSIVNGEKQDHTEDLKQLAKQAHVIAEDDPPVVGG